MTKVEVIRPQPLELLAPARNLDFGVAAIDHGADAVYIGAPAFGARAAAGNSVEDIGRLTAHAHRYGARVLVALNTILKDDELETARRIIWQVYEAGADALIVQDMGLLELDLPPIQIHASTQTDNRTAAKVRFLEAVGFSQIVLARELTLDEIRAIAAQTQAVLEFFVHGALCVSYSGQCYISHAHTGRSANRGECAQMCRLPGTLSDGNGQVLARDKHLLSLKDNDQAANLRELADAGIRSFKIEGRLKDLAYVKNVTAYYRRLLDGIIDAEPQRYRAASAGRCTFSFEPRPEKTFNRGATDYFVHGRQADIAAFDTPKFAGEPIGSVSRVGDGWFEVDGNVALNNGDGLAYFDAAQELAGLRINRVDGRRLFVSAVPAGLRPGTALYRNSDREFERLLEKKSAERRIAVRLRLSETADGLRLDITDSDGIAATAAQALPLEPARDAARAEAQLHEQLGKLGNTLFVAEEIVLDLSQPRFVPAAQINALRRAAVEALEAARLDAWQRPPRAPAVEPPAPYPADELSYLGNVFNAKARQFYERHGVRLIADAFETNRETGTVSLMVTRHCLRYSYGICPKQVPGTRPEPMTLALGGENLTLRFDCKRCEMHVVGKLMKGRTLKLAPQ